MDTKKIIEELGGRKEVVSLTGLTRARIWQWEDGNKIPTPWLKFFQAKYPKKNWQMLLQSQIPPP